MILLTITLVAFALFAVRAFARLGDRASAKRRARARLRQSLINRKG